MSIIHTGQVEIAYEETGPIDGTAIILIRGQGTQLIHWPEDFYDPFAAAGFRTIRFDNLDKLPVCKGLKIMAAYLLAI